MAIAPVNYHGDRAVDIARSKIGMCEEGGSNEGPIVVWSMRPWSRAHVGEWAQWCTAFVCTCLLEAGAPVRQVASTSCTRLWENCSQAGWAWENNLAQVPQPGDVVFFAHGEELGHTALVATYDAERQLLTTVEGNAGDCVQEAEYGLGDEQVYGFARIV